MGAAAAARLTACCCSWREKEVLPEALELRWGGMREGAEGVDVAERMDEGGRRSGRLGGGYLRGGLEAAATIE